jgi:hypothetical protein
VHARAHNLFARSRCYVSVRAHACIHARTFAGVRVTLGDLALSVAGKVTCTTDDGLDYYSIHLWVAAHVPLLTCNERRSQAIHSSHHSAFEHTAVVDSLNDNSACCEQVSVLMSNDGPTQHHVIVIVI